ncbi:MAG: hypothetical protein ABIP37_04460 [Methylotenera sp.]
MHKLLTTLFAGAFALSLGTAAFAADAVKSVEPAKAEAVKAAELAKTEATAVDAKATPAKVVKKHHRKHAKKAAEAVLTGK